MRLGLELAEKNLHSLALLIVSPSDQGKTDTLEIFAKDYEGVWVVPPSSESRMVDFFRQRRNITMIAVDEPYDWSGENYVKVAMMCKHIIEGKIQAPRSTVFVTGVNMAKSTETALVFLCNDQQYDRVRRSLAGCGLLERSITIMTQHSSFDTLDYIDRVYREKSFDDIHFTTTDVTYCTRDPSKKEQQFIDKYFTGYPRKSAMWIARTVPGKIFEELKPYLVSGIENRFVEESITFQE